MPWWGNWYSIFRKCNNTCIFTKSKRIYSKKRKNLESFEGKETAKLFDILVTPREYDPNNSYGDTLILSELKRAYEFADSAKNDDANMLLKK